MADVEALVGKNREIRGGLPETLRLRLHRALSWYQRARKEQGDPDAQFIFYWVAFNAAYCDDAAEAMYKNERSRFQEYFGKIVRYDQNGTIHDAIWKRFCQSIETFLSNRYVFSPFWKYHNGVPGYENWVESFERSQMKVQLALVRKDTVTILSVLFDRLYVLRNQLMHGGATWNSAVNRQQVKDSAGILEFLLPLFLDVMMDHPEEYWGNPHYPVVRD